MIKALKKNHELDNIEISKSFEEVEENKDSA